MILLLRPLLEEGKNLMGEVYFFRILGFKHLLAVVAAA